MLLYDNIETSRTEINRQADAAMCECKEADRNRDSFYVIFMTDATDLPFLVDNRTCAEFTFSHSLGHNRPVAFSPPQWPFNMPR